MVTYYFSSSGNDANNGTTVSTPWQTDTKFNSTTFAPGDSILFKKGDTHIGNFLLQNSGTSGNPIFIGSYDTGAMPIISAGNGFGIKALNCSYVTIDGIHAMGSGVNTTTGFSSNNEWGISAVTNQTAGVYTNIIIQNCKIGDGTGSGSYGGFMVGIGVYSDSEDYPQLNHARIDNVLIHNNNVTNTNMTGIMTYAGYDVDINTVTAQRAWTGTFRYTSSLTGGSTTHNAFAASANTPPGGSYVESRQNILGQNFSVNNSAGITITQLGAWDNNGDGIASPGIDVAILNTDTKTIVYQTNISGSGDAYIEYYRMKDIAPLFLAQGSYSIATFGHANAGNEGVQFLTGTTKGDEGSGSITLQNKVIYNNGLATAMEYPRYGLSRFSLFPLPTSIVSHFNDIFRNITVTYNYVHDTYGYNNPDYQVARAGTGIRLLNTNVADISYNKVTRCGHAGNSFSNNMPQNAANIEIASSQYIHIHHNESSYCSVIFGAGGQAFVDGMGIDAFDAKTSNSICEYNWVHHNDGPAFGYGAFPETAQNPNNILRFNVTYDNAVNTSQASAFAFAAPFNNLQIYNNLFYESITASSTPAFFTTGTENLINVKIANNIFATVKSYISWAPSTTPLKIVGNVYQNGTNLPNLRSLYGIETFDGRNTGRTESITFPNFGNAEDMSTGYATNIDKFDFLSSYTSELSLAELNTFGIVTEDIPLLDFHGNAYDINALKPGPFQVASNGNTIPVPPTLAANDNTNTLSATHILGTTEILVSTNNGSFVAYTGTISVGNVNRAYGYWRFKIKSATGRNESAMSYSPAFTIYTPPVGRLITLQKGVDGANRFRIINI